MRRAPWLVIMVVGCRSFADGSEAPSGQPEGHDASVTDAGVRVTPDGQTTDPEVEDRDAGGTPGSTSYDKGLLAYWKLDETSGTKAKDSVGTHDGNVVNGAWAPGQVGGAYATNSTGHIGISYEPALDVGTSFTIAAWVWLDNTTHDSWIFTHGYEFYVKLNGRYPQLAVGAGYYNVYPALPAKEWHHLAWVLDAGVPKIYLDGTVRGQRENTFNAKVAVGPAGSGLVIGGDKDGTNNAVGSIDDVRLWNRALNAAEIAALAKPN